MLETKNLEQETGRSMVEMLGVLAVIGVLSVTGVAGYQRAMTKHRANELVNEVSKRAVVVATQIQAGRTASISEFNNTNIAGLGVGIDSTIGRDGDKLFSIKTDGNITKEICQQVYNAIGDKTAVRLLQSGTTDVTSADKCAASAPLTFVYNSELSSEGLGYDAHLDPDDGTKCAEGYYPAGKCNLQCTGNTKVNAAGTGCDCKTGYKGTDCTECNTGYGKNTDNQCVTCPANSANNGDTTQATNITGCYCNTGYKWDESTCIEDTSCSPSHLEYCTTEEDCLSSELGGAYYFVKKADYSELDGDICCSSATDSDACCQAVSLHDGYGMWSKQKKDFKVVDGTCCNITEGIGGEAGGYEREECCNYTYNYIFNGLHCCYLDGHGEGPVAMYNDCVNTKAECDELGNEYEFKFVTGKGEYCMYKG